MITRMLLPQPKWWLVCYCPNPNDYSYTTAPTQMITRMLLSQPKWLLVCYLYPSLCIHASRTFIYEYCIHAFRHFYIMHAPRFYARSAINSKLLAYLPKLWLQTPSIMESILSDHVYDIYVHISSSDYRSGWGVSRPFIVPAPPAFSQIKSNHRLAIVCGSSHCPTNGIQATTWPSWPQRLFCQQRLETRLPKGSTKVRRQKNKRKSKANSRRKWIICMVMNSRKRFLMPWCSRCCGDDKRLLQHFESNHKLWR